LSAGFAPPIVPQPNARCSPVTPVLMCGSFEQHLLSLKGALLGPLYNLITVYEGIGEMHWSGHELLFLFLHPGVSSRHLEPLAPDAPD